MQDTSLRAGIFVFRGFDVNYFPDQVFLGLQEIAGEITLIIPLAYCQHHCIGCHSPQYQDEFGGEVLTEDRYLKYLQQYKDKASCICLFGGEHSPLTLSAWSGLAQGYGFHTALYSGFDFEELPEGLADCFNYIKVGSYREELGGLDSRTTNQRMLRREADGSFVDITKEFWR